MKKVCLNLQLHQPFRLKRYRFFDIGNDHYYFDDFQNEEIFNTLVKESYIPALKLLKDMIFYDEAEIKVSLAISGTALEQIELYAPELLDMLSELNEAGHIEFVTMPYAYSLSSLGDVDEFKKEVNGLTRKIEILFGKRPKVFRNTELIYSDDIAKVVNTLGYDTIMTEGAKHILGWKSPNYLYKSIDGKSKLLLRHSDLSKHIVRNFSNPSWSEYPLTAEKLAGWISKLPEEEQIVFLDIPLETLGHIHKKDTGIFDFFQDLPRAFKAHGIQFVLPSVIAESITPAASISVQSAISCAEEEKGITSWLGNVLQQESFRKMVEHGERARLCTDRRIKQDWLHLQSADHFFYMTTLYQDVKPFSPYDNPYDAFNNYMNVLSDMILRIEAQYPASIENEELNALLLTIKNQDKTIAELKEEINVFKARLDRKKLQQKQRSTRKGDH